METEINSQENKWTKQHRLFPKWRTQLECEHQPQPKQQVVSANCKHNWETEKFQIEQQHPMLQEKQLKPFQKQKSKMTLYRKS